MSSTERISFLQEKLQEIRKYYLSLKSEVASIDRRRKRLKKKEREGTMDSLQIAKKEFGAYMFVYVLLLSVPHNGLHKLLGFLGHSHESVISLPRPEHSGCGVQVMTRPPQRSIVSPFLPSRYVP